MGQCAVIMSALYFMCTGNYVNYKSYSFKDLEEVFIGGVTAAEALCNNDLFIIRFYIGGGVWGRNKTKKSTTVTFYFQRGDYIKIRILLGNKFKKP